MLNESCTNILQSAGNASLADKEMTAFLSSSCVYLAFSLQDIKVRHDISVKTVRHDIVCQQFEWNDSRSRYLNYHIWLVWLPKKTYSFLCILDPKPSQNFLLFYLFISSSILGICTQQFQTQALPNLKVNSQHVEQCIAQEINIQSPDVLLRSLGETEEAPDTPLFLACFL